MGAFKTIYTAPRGFADVVVDDSGFYRVRIRVRGQWRTLPTSHTPNWRGEKAARDRADQSDQARAEKGER